MAGDALHISRYLGEATNDLIQQTQYREKFEKRQDPFRPKKKLGSNAPTRKKAQSKSPTVTLVPAVENPNWKLLGIIHGQFGRQAVIQISPKERVFVGAGLEVFRSGWIIKSIQKAEVRMEYISPSILKRGPTKPKAFTLSFSTPGKSS